MLLRRVIKHVKEQNWTAVGLDFLIVVVGVFIGIQVANWNESRQESATRQLMHERLVKDFERIKQQSDDAVKRIEKILASLITLQRTVRRGRVSADEKAQVVYALEFGFSYPAINQRSDTYVELLSSGRLDLIDNEHLRVALLAYDQRVQQSRFNETQINEYLSDNVSLVAFGRYREFAPPVRNENGEYERGPIRSFDIAGMTKDAEFREQLDRMIENRTWLVSNVYHHRRAVDKVLTVLSGRPIDDEAL
ncbi:MAG: hypothetical protein AAGC71_15810 [Pseudomonadota bacterium]